MLPVVIICSKHAHPNSDPIVVDDDQRISAEDVRRRHASTKKRSKFISVLVTLIRACTEVLAIFYKL